MQQMSVACVTKRATAYILVGSPKITTDKLQQQQNAAARIISSTHKFDQDVSHLLHTSDISITKIIPNSISIKLWSFHFNFISNFSCQLILVLIPVIVVK